MARIRLNDSVLIPGKGQDTNLLAWYISFFGALALLILLPIFIAKPYREIVAFIPDGLGVTFQVTVLSILLSLSLGMLAVLARVSKIHFLNHISGIYTEVFRGIPLLVQIFYIYFVLGNVLQFNFNGEVYKISPLILGVIAISICYGAYIAEVLRAGVQAIPRGQMEAAIALGMSRWQAIFKVILTQTIKIVLPPIGNECIMLLKDSSLISMISVVDILRRTREYASTTFNYFAGYTMVALVYLVLTLFFSRLVGLMEKRLHKNART